MRRRACVVAASETTVRAFLLNQIAAMQGAYDVTVVVNTTDLAFLKDLGITADVVPVRIERGIALREDIKALIRITRLCRRELFDIVHSITPKAGLLTMLGGLLARTPVRVHTFTGQVWATRSGPSRALLKAADRFLATSATFTIVDSASQRDFLIQEGVVAASKSVVLGNGSVSGVDGQKFRPDPQARHRIRAELGIAVDDLVLLFVGRLTLDKGVVDLAQAFARIADVRGDVRLLAVGPDEQQMRPRMLAAVGYHAARLHFVDLTHEPQAFMAASDVLCLPSYREGFGSVIVEAAAVGLPSVASRIYGVIDAMQEGRTGLSHPPHDVQAIATTLLRILSDAELRRRLGAAARERALRDFSQASMTDALLELYDRLLQRESSDQMAAGGKVLYD